MCVNGMDIELLSSGAYDIIRLVEACTVEAMGHGVYVHGSEGGDDLADVAVGHTIPRANDPKEIARLWTRLFPMLPAPPPAPLLIRGRGYFEAPRNQRYVIAERRSEEERVALEIAKQEARAQARELADQLEGHAELANIARKQSRRGSRGGGSRGSSRTGSEDEVDDDLQSMASSLGSEDQAFLRLTQELEGGGEPDDELGAFEDLDIAGDIAGADKSFVVGSVVGSVYANARKKFDFRLLYCNLFFVF